MILEGHPPVFVLTQNISSLKPPPLIPFPSRISEEGLVSFRDSHSLESTNLSVLAYPLHPHKILRHSQKKCLSLRLTRDHPNTSGRVSEVTTTPDTQGDILAPNQTLEHVHAPSDNTNMTTMNCETGEVRSTTTVCVAVGKADSKE